MHANGLLYNGRSTFAKLPLVGWSVDVYAIFRDEDMRGAATGWWRAACRIKAGGEVCRLRLVRCGCSQQHYTVRHLAVMAECTCNGHNVDCRPSNSTGSYECVCGGNTTGRYCDACLPLYNQQPFRYGVPCEGRFLLPCRLDKSERM